MSIMEQLFGPDVSLIRKLLTLATFPIWGMLLTVAGLFCLFVFGLSVAMDVLENISDR